MKFLGFEINRTKEKTIKERITILEYQQKEIIKQQEQIVILVEKLGI